MTSNLWVIFFIFIGSIALGAFFYEYLLSKLIDTRKKVARNHTLRCKPLASPDELQVWAWLEQVFPEHQILVKIPFTSFIEPDQHSVDAHWKSLLSSVSFSCAVANRKGVVLGCIDVLVRGHSEDRNHGLKRQLLARAGLPYWILNSGARPNVKVLREKFLGNEQSSAELQRVPKDKESQYRPTTRTPLPLAILEKRQLSRLSINATAMARSGITTGKVRSRLKLLAIARTMMAKMLGVQKSPNYYQTGSSLS